MQFLPELKEFLLKEGMIHTVRGYEMKAAWVNVEGVGKCYRAPKGAVHSKDDIEKYVETSGFANVDNWWAKIQSFIKSGQTMYLYAVYQEKK